MDEEMEGLREQLCQTIEVLYEDQYALIIIGETEQDGEVMPDGGSPILLANIISAAMEKNSELRDIIRLAMMVYEEDNPNPIHLN